MLVNTAVYAKDTTHKEKKKSLSTNVNFDDRLVGGKYQYSTEAITKVENDYLQILFDAWDFHLE